MMDDMEPQQAPALRTIAMPSNVNVNGDIFGGWVLSQMDLAASVVAGQRARGRVATVAIDAMKFIRPVRVGDILSIYATVAREGRTSMGIALEAWSTRRTGEHSEKVTEALFTFVAIDEEGRPRPLPAAGA